LVVSKPGFRIDAVRIRENDILLGYFGSKDARVGFSRLVDGRIIPETELTHEVGLEGVIPYPATLTISPDSKLIAYTCVKDTAIELWDFPPRRQKPVRLLDEVCGAYCMAFSADTTRLAAADADQKLRIWDLKTKAVLERVTLPRLAVLF